MSVFIIAEAGVNHNGDMALAKELIEMAAWAGADAVKFQTFKADTLASHDAKTADYQKQGTGEDSQFDMLKGLELTYDDFTVLKRHCDENGILFMSTAFDADSIDFINSLGVAYLKVPSGEITNLPYLIRVAEMNRPVILSTGMCDITEIEDAVDVLTKNGCRKITLLHCCTEYPTPMHDVNLRVLKTLSDKFDLPVGYSDHTLGGQVAVAAVALGATVIEKHFTLDKTMKGADHAMSLAPHELKKMISDIRDIESALGSDKKMVMEDEGKNKKLVRKSIVASCAIKKGETLTEDNLTVKRPGDGISPMQWFDVLGKTAARDFEADEQIEL